MTDCKIAPEDRDYLRRSWIRLTYGLSDNEIDEGIRRPAYRHSPMIPTQFGVKAFLLRTYQTDEDAVGFDGQPFQDSAGQLVKKTNSRIVHYTPQTDDLVTNIADIEDIEDQLISQAPVKLEKRSQLPFALRQQAAYVAARGRRGYANGVLMHPLLADQFAEINWAQDWSETSQTTGRWTSVGGLTKCPGLWTTVWVSAHMPTNEFALFYTNRANRIDSVAAFLDHPDGHLYFCQPQDPGLLLHQSQNYITRVLLEDA